MSASRVNPYLTQQVETSGVALPVPRGACREFVPGADDEACEWTLGPLHVRYRRQCHDGVPGFGDGRQVEASIGGHRVAVWFQPSRVAPSAYVADPAQRGVVHAISVGGSNAPALRQWVLAEALRGLRFVNFHHGLRVTGINATRGSFTWCNEVGRARTSVRGDVVTRDGGRVVRVRPDRVVLAEPGFDAHGGPCLAERILWLEGVAARPSDLTPGEASAVT